MATSGSVNTTKYDGRYYTLSWTAKQSTATNKSTISWTLKAVAGNDSWYAERTLKVVIAGETVYTKTARVERYTGTIATGSITLTHNAEGAKSFSVSVEAAVYVSTVNCTGSKTFTLDTIPRKAVITAGGNFDDEDNPKITYSNPAGTSVTTLQAGIYAGDGKTALAAYRDISKTGSSYTFNLTEAERNKIRAATPNSNTAGVRIYIKTVIGDTTYTDYIALTVTIINAKPTLTPTAVDKGSVSTGLTGDVNTIIKNYNVVEVNSGAKAVKGATIKSQKITCGSQIINSGSGDFYYVDSNKFVFTVTDSRGNTTTQTLTKPFINYVNLSCNLSVKPPNTAGEMSFTISGNFFNGDFGAYDNVLTLQYMIGEGEDTGGEWINVYPTYSGNTYSATVNLTGLNYQSYYTLQARAKDYIYSELNPILTPQKIVRTTPVFDWSEDDFNFNVPVTMKHGGNSYNLLGLFRAMTTTYALPCEVTTGGNYSSATVTAHLTGSNLRIGVSATRSASLSAGNFDNETVATIDIDHGGKLANLYRVSFNTSTSGGVATLDCQATIVDDNTVRITIYLCAAAHSLTSFNAYFAMPCTIITKAYV